MTTDAPQSDDLRVLYDALVGAAGEDGRTRVGYDEALRSAGSIEQFSRDGELDEARVEAAARGLIEQGLLEVRGPGYKYVGAAVGRSSSSRGRKGAAGKRSASRKRAAARSSAARSSAGGRRGRATGARKATASASSSRASARSAGSRSGSSSRSRAASGGSPYLAETLRDLLDKMTTEVSTVSALSARIDGAAQELQTMLEEYSDRIATLGQLRATTSDGPLATFLAEELRPDRPTELEALDKASARAQRADV